jgi:hypothetical protein
MAKSGGKRFGIGSSIHPEEWGQQLTNLDLGHVQRKARSLMILDL